MINDTTIASYNCGNNLRNKWSTICARIKKCKIDILLLQDTGIRTEGQEGVMQRLCEGEGLRFYSKSIAPSRSAGYSRKELTQLTALAIKKGSKGRRAFDSLATIVGESMVNRLAVQPRDYRTTAYNTSRFLGSWAQM